MSRFARIVEDPEYDEDFEDFEEDMDFDPEISSKVFDRLVEELSPFGTVNS